MPKPDFVIQGLIDLGRPIMLEHWTADSCVAATRVGLDVLFHYEINDASPLSVGVLAMNAPAAIHMANGEPMNIPAWHPIDGSAAVNSAWLWPTVIPWRGHLVITREGNLIDLSMDQWSRPADQMIFAAGRLVSPEGFATGAAELHHTFENGSAIWYKAWPDDHGYEPSPDWNGGPALDEIRAEIIAAIDANIEA